MRRIIIAITTLFGLTGSAKAARHIGKLEQTAQKLNDAVDQINREIVDAAYVQAEKKAAFDAAEKAHNDEQFGRSTARDRALRVALRMSSLVS